MKILLTMVIAIVGLYGFVVFFSQRTTNYECSGVVSGEPSGSGSQIYFELNEYRPWVGLWSDSDGSITVESPSQYLEYHSMIEDLGSTLQIYDGSSPVGRFSKLSDTIAIMTVDGFFDGSCTIRA